MPIVYCGLDRCVHNADFICRAEQIDLSAEHYCGGGCDMGWEYEEEEEKREEQGPDGETDTSRDDADDLSRYLDRNGYTGEQGFLTDLAMELSERPAGHAQWVRYAWPPMTAKASVRKPGAVDGWVLCSEKMPEGHIRCLVTAWACEKDGTALKVLPYFVWWDGERWADDHGLECPFEVIAWQRVRLPEPYKGGVCEKT